MSANIILILDDEYSRLDAMVAELRKNFASRQVVTFDNAPEINQWLETNLESCCLICLDHDLGANRFIEGVETDPGIGRDVADFLATREPVCPIVIHTTNTLARPGMIFVLEEAGWSVTYVSPYADTQWIGEVWLEELGQVLGN